MLRYIFKVQQFGSRWLDWNEEKQSEECSPNPRRLEYDEKHKIRIRTTNQRSVNRSFSHLFSRLPFGQLRQTLLTRPHRGVDDLQEQLSFPKRIWRLTTSQNFLKFEVWTADLICMMFVYVYIFFNVSRF